MNDNQVPMVVENTDSSKDGNSGGNSAPEAAGGSNQESASNHENSTSARTDTNTDSNKRALEESDFTRPQEELLFL